MRFEDAADEIGAASEQEEDTFEDDEEEQLAPPSASHGGSSLGSVTASEPLVVPDELASVLSAHSDPAMSQVGSLLNLLTAQLNSAN